MRIEFVVDEVWLHADYSLVAGAVNGADIRLGEIFSVLIWTPKAVDPVIGNPASKPNFTYSVELKIEGIEAYRHPLDWLPGGMTGMLRLRGVGQELLKAIEPRPRNGTWMLAVESWPKRLVAS